MEPIKIRSIDGIELDAVIHPRKGNTPLGCVIQVHGITADMDEGGMFVRLAERLANSGFDVLRFTYRGHGKSGGTQRGVTIAGEMLDLQAAFDFAIERFNEPLAIVAASFGAVSTCLLHPYIEKRIRALALWNPVLDLIRTFINPELPWGKQNFNKECTKQLISRGFLLLDGSFEIGRVLWEEMQLYNPYRCFVESSVPAMIVHGDKDSYVPYSVSRTASQQRNRCDFFTIEGSDHGFDGREKEDRAIDITVNWLEKLFRSRTL
uniref:Serine aminopeptidase S33 domain-containing protein n=1 Tax=Candidatus Methanophagaceae archaeon ANME-1 ERB6 TaxID=2759912 RepID=A0A7G9YTX9_9EURY|nr:hypothetical protein OGFGKJAA_00029 [Methanosarcinales archaeon ANME-1 ERB6]